MDSIYRLETITDLNNLLGQEKPKHPLVSVIDFSKVTNYGYETMKMTSGFYSIMFKNSCHSQIKYGQKQYDFQEGTLLCMAPNQVLYVDNEVNVQDDLVGWGLFFHPDILKGTHLAKKMKEYSFFSYQTNEALHLSDKEKETLNECIKNILKELEQNIDKHTQTLLVSTIELFLNYCYRYYDRQFVTRNVAHKDILIRFETLLEDYFASGKLREMGLPTVKYFAKELFLSTNYFSDLLKKETGKSAKDHIQYRLIEESKIRLLSTNDTISEIAYDLGFEYPQYFSTLFKNKEGTTPASFRANS